MKLLSIKMPSMRVPPALLKMSIFEMVLFIGFILYIVLPIRTPGVLAPYIDSIFGMIVLFCITVSLFVYTNPILGVLYILVAYEVMRRSSSNKGNTKAIIMEYTPSQMTKDADMHKMNPTVEKTVEEEVIEVRAPIGKAQPTEYIATSFKPVADKLEGASLV
jgi:predicted membrane protein